MTACQCAVWWLDTTLTVNEMLSLLCLFLRLYKDWESSLHWCVERCLLCEAFLVSPTTDSM